MPAIYVVEDEESIRGIIVYALQAAGFAAEGFESSSSFFAAVAKELPLLVLLDIMLPEEDGLTILKRLRSRSTTSSLPVILLTARSSEHDKVIGLDLGADDYVTKPFGVMELISRVNALLRRSQGKATEQISLGSLTIDHARRLVQVSGETINLTLKEYELLYFLMQNAGLVLSRTQILNSVWGYDFAGESRTVDMHIKALRQKLGAAAEQVVTVRGVGYKIEE